MRLLIALSLSWLKCLMSSPVHNTHDNSDKPYGYAPYVWIAVTSCSAQTAWCQGTSRTGFALSVTTYNRTSDLCTHYCPGGIYAHWRPLQRSARNLFRHKAE
ncbi:hypothetical protein DPEC_G00374620, partial [Dallia pectoralis]